MNDIASEEIQKAIEENKPEHVAIKIYDVLLPQFDAQIRHLSKKGLFRVLTSLVKTPLVENIKLDKLEANVYAIVDRLMQAKMIMVASVVNEQEIAARAANEEKKENG